MRTKHANIFSNIPINAANELFETLLIRETLKIERIASHGHSTPAGEWYDQVWDEWVLVLQGQALIEFEEDKLVDLQTGDYLFIPSHKRHRVKWTAPGQDTLWLAIHIKPNPP